MRSFEQTFKLQVPSSPENLAIIRDFVTSVGAQAGLSEEEVANLELAVDEACANVIEHAYGNDVSQELTVRATFDEDELRIGIVDVEQVGSFDVAQALDVSGQTTARCPGAAATRVT